MKYVCYKSNIIYDHFSYEELCLHFNPKTLQSRRSITDLRFLQKILSNNINCPYLVSEVGLRVPHRVLRDKPTVSVQSRLNVREDNFFPRTLALSNRLNLYDDLVMRTPNDFKTVVSSLFL